MAVQNIGRPSPNFLILVIQILFELITAGFTAAKAYEHRNAVAKSHLLWVLYRDAAFVFTVSALVVNLGYELTRRQTILSITSSSIQSFIFLTTTLGLRTLNLIIWIFGPLSMIFVGVLLPLSALNVSLTAVS